MLFLNALEKIPSCKSLYVFYKKLRKALMHRTRLHSKFLKEKTTLPGLAYNKKRNICVSTLCKSKKPYFENLYIKNLNDNRKFGGSVKPLFLNKVKSNVHVALRENDQYF